MRKNRISLEGQDFTVKLKPILGVKPGHYLAVLYAVALLLFLFWIFVYPGVVRGGELVYFDGTPDQAAVVVDGQYRGAMPGEVFVPAGDRVITISKPGFEDGVVEQHFSRRLVGSRFFPKRRTLTVALSPSAGFQDAAEATLLDHANWGMVGAFSERYQYPPVLTTFARTVADSGAPPNLVSAVADSMRNVSTSEMLRDYLNARAIIASGGGHLTLSGISQLAKDLSTEMEQHPNLPLLGAALLPHDLASKESSWFTRYDDLRTQRLGVFSNPPPKPGATIEVDGAVYREVPAGYGLAGEGDLVYVADLPSFYILDREITQGMFGRFLRDVPTWTQDDADPNLVSDEYLKDFDPDATPNAPLAYVSWYAAKAYCDWLETKLGGAYEVRLPLESEWYRASAGFDTGRFSLSEPPGPVDNTALGPLGLHDMVGSLWEWCENGYRPADFAFGSWGQGSLPDLSQLPAAEKAVRGGSWANPSAVLPETRAGQPAESSTPYLGFRPVLIPRQGS